MEYTERQHAFISATFYKKLKEGYGEKGLAVFVLATQRYAEQRGSRMAQKAIMLGMPLNFESYFALGEWNYSESFLKSVNGKNSKYISGSPDSCINVFACAWHEQYKAMGLIDGAILYCRHLDMAIVRGFNPYLKFRVKQTLHETDKCVQELKDANLESIPKKLMEWIKPFEYHCAHIYHTYSEIAKSVLKTNGEELSASVLEDFAKEYGKESAERLISYKDTNFNVF